MDRPLVTAGIASFALACTLLFVPAAPWRLPLALLGGLWAPGYALVRLAYPRGILVGIERHALAAAVGLLLVPLAALAVSFTVGLSPRTLGTALAFVTLGAGAWAWHTGGPTEPEARTRAPTTKVTLALCGVSLAITALLVAPSIAFPASTPASLALADPTGLPLPRTSNCGSPLVAHIVARAGSQPAAGTLRVTWGQSETQRVLLEERWDLPAGAQRDVTVPLPCEGAGAYEVAATWNGRAVHSALVVRELP